MSRTKRVRQASLTKSYPYIKEEYYAQEYIYEYYPIYKDSIRNDCEKVKVNSVKLFPKPLKFNDRAIISKFESDGQGRDDGKSYKQIKKLYNKKRRQKDRRELLKELTYDDYIGDYSIWKTADSQWSKCIYG